jgi:hypothetical protein
MLLRHNDCVIRNAVSRFSRAYDSALSAAGISRATAAKIAGIHGSTLSRIMADEFAASPDSVEGLLRALTDQADRLHCLREFLFDQTPTEFWPTLVIHFSELNEPRARPPIDSLHDALQELERTATGDRELRQLLVDLAKIMARPEHRHLEATPAHAYEEERAAVQRLAPKEGIPTPTLEKPSLADSPTGNEVKC